MLLDEAKRCLKCKNPRCQKACPIATDVPTVMRLFEEGKIREAGEVLFSNNPMTAICSVVCPHENNCYGNCVLGLKSDPVKFYEIEQYISGFYIDTFDKHPPEKNGFRVAVIGAGPAGISMSILLAMKGFEITLIEAQDKIGGVLRYGIPEFRLPKARLEKYEHILKKLGVKFKPNTYIGSNLSIDDMFMDGYDAVFVAVGTAKPNRLGLLGETLGHVHYAIDYLKSPDAYDLGRRVVVIGAGNVAMDAARMAVRKIGEGTVTIINNRREQDMTAAMAELEMAKLEGVSFEHLLATLRIDSEGVLCAKVDATEGEDGKILYEENLSQRVKVPADTVIIAIGQGPMSTLSDKAQISTNWRGLLKVDESGMTNIPGVFAAGDVVSGPKTVVEAVAYTKMVAQQIERYCNEHSKK